MKILTLNKLAAEPAAPSAGHVAVYTKNDAQLYLKGPDNVELVLVSTPNTYVLGYAERYNAAYSSLGNTILAYPVELIQGGVLESMSIWCGTAGGNIKMGIYDNTGPGKTTADAVVPGPGNLLGECAQFAAAEQRWNEAALTTEVSLAAGTYWLAFMVQNSAFVTRRTATSFGWTLLTASQTYSASMPATFPTGVTLSDARASFYGNMQLQEESAGV